MLLILAAIISLAMNIYCTITAQAPIEFAVFLTLSILIAGLLFGLINTYED